MSTLLTADEFVSDGYMATVDDRTPMAVQIAIDIAEGDISRALGYPPDDDGAPTFLSSQRTEEHRWPHPNRPLQLNIPRLSSLDTVTALHDDGTCDCGWTELTACGFIFDERESIVKFRDCSTVRSCWTGCGCKVYRVQVVYTAGFAAADVVNTQPTGRRLRLAIALQARSILELQSYYTDGNVAVSNYSSLGYSEKREFERTATGRKLGLSMLSQAAADILEPLMRKKRFVVLRSQ